MKAAKFKPFKARTDDKVMLKKSFKIYVQDFMTIAFLNLIIVYMHTRKQVFNTHASMFTELRSIADCTLSNLLLIYWELWHWILINLMYLFRDLRLWWQKTSVALAVSKCFLLGLRMLLNFRPQGVQSVGLSVFRCLRDRSLVFFWNFAWM